MNCLVDNCSPGLIALIKTFPSRPKYRKRRGRQRNVLIRKIVGINLKDLLPCFEILAWRIRVIKPFLMILRFTWQRHLCRDRCRPISCNHSKCGRPSVSFAKLFQECEPTVKVHSIPWHRKLLDRAFARSILYRESVGLCTFFGPFRSKKAGEEKQLYPFIS